MLMASNAIIESVTARGRITARDVDTMRKAYSSDVAITEGEVGELFQLNVTCRKQAQSWTDFFAETIAGFVLQQRTPDGGISESNAKWLASRIAGKTKISAAERAVLNAIKQAVPKANPTLKPLLELVR
jgi:hypothetical protein